MLKVAGLVVALWALVVLATTTLGARRADPIQWQSGFEVCDLPCWSGITPGQTRFADVAPLLQRTLSPDSRLLVSGSQVDFWTEANGAPFYGYLYYAKGSVDNVQMHVEFPVGQIIRRLGAPDCVYLETLVTGEHLLAIYWEMKIGMVGALVRLDHERWGPNSAIGTLFLNSPQAACNRDDAVRWRGFAPFAYYKALLD